MAHEVPHLSDFALKEGILSPEPIVGRGYGYNQYNHKLSDNAKGDKINGVVTEQLYKILAQSTFIFEFGEQSLLLKNASSRQIREQIRIFLQTGVAKRVSDDVSDLLSIDRSVMVGDGHYGAILVRSGMNTEVISNSNLYNAFLDRGILSLPQMRD